MAAEEEDTYASRFTITVPAPKARINLGKPIEGDAPFGYTGMTLQSDVHLFIDVNKYSFFQSGGSYWQAGGQWLQYSSTEMVMSSATTNMLSGAGRVTLVAGAGQGGVTALDHAQQHVAPRFEPYNNLDLHYRVEETHNTLRELFYGAKWKDAAIVSQAEQIEKNERTVPAPDYAGGLLQTLWTHLGELGYAGPQRVKLLEPLEWKGNFMEMGRLPPFTKSSVYPGLQAFDPYPATQFNDKSVVGTALAGFIQTVNFFHRFSDLLGKISNFITDNQVMKRVTNLITAWRHAQEAGVAALNVADIARWNRSGDRKAGEAGAFGDEFDALPARAGAVDGFAPTNAVLQSAKEPFDCSGLSAKEMYIDITSIEGEEPQRIYVKEATAEAIVTAMNGKGGFVAANADGVITVAHYATGKVSYLEVSGPLASRIWGGDPTIARGKENTPLENLEVMRTIQWEFAKWPEDVKNQMRPVLTALRDVVEVYDHIYGVAEEAMKALSVLPAPPNMLGLFAEEGITLGTGGPVLGVGPSITFVAAKTRDPDPSKFVLAPIEQLFSVGPDKWNQWKKSITPGFFKTPNKTTHQDPVGFRVVSEADISLISQEETRIVAVSRVSVEGDMLELRSKSMTNVQALKGSLRLTGQTILLGSERTIGMQEATETLNIRSKEATIATSQLIAIFDAEPGKIDIGAMDTNTYSIDRAKPRVYINTDAAVEIGVGDNNGSITHGLSINKDGVAELLSSDALELMGTSVKLTGKTEVAGDFKVGSALTVKNGTTKIKKMATPKTPIVNTRRIAIPNEYKALMATAKTLREGIDGIIAARKVVENEVPRGRSAHVAQKGKLKAFDLQIQAQLDQLEKLRIQREELMNEADSLRISKDLGASDDDEAVFIV